MFLIANGLHFGLTNSMGYNMWPNEKEGYFRIKPEPGIMMGYRWCFFKQSPWFLDWNFIDIPYQRAFRVGKLFHDRQYAVYGIMNPFTMMQCFSKKDKDYDISDLFFRKHGFSESLGDGFVVGVGNSYCVSKNITISLEYVFQTNYSFELIRHLLVFGIEFHRATRNQ